MSMYAIPDNVLDKHLAVLGINGSGKTYTAKGAVERLLDEKARVCIIDPTGVWWGLKSSATGKSGAYPLVIFGGSHADLQIGGTHGETIAEAIGTSNTPSIIDTSLMRTGERVKFFTDFAETIRRVNKGPLHLFIDEAHIFAPQGRVPDPQSGAMLHAANNLISLGRSRGLRVTLISQRPAKLHKDSLTQAHSLITMRLIAPQDRKAVEAWIEDQADPAEGKKIIASLPQLATGEGWIWSPENRILQKVKFPKIKTFDSSRTPDGEDESDGPVLAAINIEAMQDKLAIVAKQAVSNDPVRLRKRIAELEANKSLDPEAMTKAQNEGYRKGKIDGYGEGLLHASGEFDARLEVAVAAFQKAISTGSKKLERWKATPDTALLRIERPKAQKLVAAASDALPNSQRRILRSLHFWHSVGQENPSREQVAGVAGYSPGSGGFNNLVGTMKTNGLIGSQAQGTLCLSALQPGYEMASTEAKNMLLSVLSNPHQKIVSAFNGDASLSRDEVAGRSGYSAGSGGFNNLVGKLNTLNILERPAQGMLAITEWAREVLQ